MDDVISIKQAELDSMIEIKTKIIALAETTSKEEIDAAHKVIQDCKRRKIFLEESRPENVIIAERLAAMEKQKERLQKTIDDNLKHNDQLKKRISDITADMCNVERAHSVRHSRDRILGYDTVCVRCKQVFQGPSSMVGFNPNLRKLKYSNDEIAFLRDEK